MLSCLAGSAAESSVSSSKTACVSRTLYASVCISQLACAMMPWFTPMGVVGVQLHCSKYIAAAQPKTLEATEGKTPCRECLRPSSPKNNKPFHARGPLQSFGLKLGCYSAKILQLCKTSTLSNPAAQLGETLETGRPGPLACPLCCWWLVGKAGRDLLKKIPQPVSCSFPTNHKQVVAEIKAPTFAWMLT